MDKKQSKKDIFEQQAKTRLKIWKKLRRKPYQKKRVLVPAIIIFVLILSGIFAFFNSLKYQSTDDAFVEGRLISIAPKISGQVVKLNVNDNDFVKKGQLLLEIDSRDYQNKVDELESALQEAMAKQNISENDVKKSEANLSNTDKGLASAKHKLRFAKNDFDRYSKLKKEGLCTTQEYDESKTKLDIAKEEFQQAEDIQRAMKAAVQSDLSKKEASLANTKKIEAELAQAKLMLSYTQIYAPCDGNISSRNVEEGNYLHTGQPIMVIVSPELWVVANFKETQLANMQKGQEVTIKVDTFSGKKFKGKVDSIQKASGAKASLFPPENAVGSYIKVVQRIPVKIVFAEDYQKYNIVPGMSVIPKVKIR